MSKQVPDTTSFCRHSWKQDAQILQKNAPCPCFCAITGYATMQWHGYVHR